MTLTCAKMTPLSSTQNSRQLGGELELNEANEVVGLELHCLSF